uniref:Uncharacterized protein n=1 Tax=uncultured Acidobacteriota bacterium TaxID=171953 RepID=H5SPQ6_9BACT|nr:hypothetical protein HGMM_F54F02C25 [uncultured Acidobacteriota bacterium]
MCGIAQEAEGVRAPTDEELAHDNHEVQHEDAAEDALNGFAISPWREPGALRHIPPPSLRSLFDPHLAQV